MTTSTSALTALGWDPGWAAAFAPFSATGGNPPGW